MNSNSEGAKFLRLHKVCRMKDEVIEIALLLKSASANLTEEEIIHFISGRPPQAALRHNPERHSEGVHGPQHVHLPT